MTRVEEEMMSVVLLEDAHETACDGVDGPARGHAPALWLALVALTTLVGASGSAQERQAEEPVRRRPARDQRGSGHVQERLRDVPRHGCAGRVEGAESGVGTLHPWRHRRRSLPHHHAGRAGHADDGKRHERRARVEDRRVLAQPDGARRPGRVDGDRANGEALFFGRAACATCHIVNGRGGRLGPELSRIGSSRSPEFVRDKIRNPNDLGKGTTHWPLVGARSALALSARHARHPRRHPGRRHACGTKTPTRSS